MKFTIKHELKGRIRVHMAQSRMSYEEADTLLYYLQSLPEVENAKVYERTADAVVFYSGDRESVIGALRSYRFENTEVPEGVIEHSGRKLNAEYREKLIRKVILRFGGKLFLPYPVRAAIIAVKASGYILRGIRSLKGGKLKVEALDATAIGVSLLRRDFNTAASVMFLLGIGEILEEWTHKKSVGDLARSMSLNVSRVWLKQRDADGKGEQEVLVSASDICPGDEVVVHMGNVIPFDGVVTAGEGMVNQSSMTGESLPVHKTTDGYVYAGTVLEEGELTVAVRATSGSTRYEKIVAMIEESERLKSGMESKAERLADRLVPYTLAGTGLVWLFTRNITKALAVLMVDFSCALKLAMPIAVLSAIREANARHITVKGGKYLEAVAEAETIVFDKTGTLTEARPSVRDVVVFGSGKKDEMLRIAACLEEHFPHPMAKAVVTAARQKNLDHEEMHSKVDYLVAHGISSYIGDRKVIIGSYHFVFEDEGCSVAEEYREAFEQLPDEYSHLYMAIDGRLTAVICIEDPLRPEAADAIRALRAAGIRKIVMMTGDSERAAAAVAAKVGVDEYYSEVLPEEKAAYIERQKADGGKVIMVGDGINDSPALSAANAGVAVSDGAEIAREIADITVSEDSLWGLVTLKQLSNRLMRRIQQNYRAIVGINTGLIGLGVGGVIQPTTSALLHNTSTLVIGLKSMQNLLEDDGKTGR